jgi:hypothetical protein
MFGAFASKGTRSDYNGGVSISKSVWNISKRVLNLSNTRCSGSSTVVARITYGSNRFRQEKVGKKEKRARVEEDDGDSK